MRTRDGVKIEVGMDTKCEYSPGDKVLYYGTEFTVTAVGEKEALLSSGGRSRWVPFFRLPRKPNPQPCANYGWSESELAWMRELMVCPGVEL